jgi:hypothetical protein
MNLLTKKGAYIFVGIAAICLILGPILGMVTKTITIHERRPETVKEYSTAGISQAFNLDFTLAKDQKLIVEISEFYPNSSITLKILARSTYEAALRVNSTPGSVSGLEFVYSVFGWGTTPAGGTNGATSRSLPSNGLYLYIEFMGTRSGDALISWPGDYNLIVYGTNSGGPTDVDVFFDIKVSLDGPGDMLSNLLIIIGILLLLFYFLSAIVTILKKNYFR